MMKDLPSHHLYSSRDSNYQSDKSFNVSVFNYKLWRKQVTLFKASSFNTFNFLLVLVISIHSLSPTVLASHHTIVFENGAYRDLVITFDPNVPKEQGPSLLDSIQETFKAFSDNLYEITNKTACFDEIIALVPHSWLLGSRKYNSTRSFTALDADIYIHSAGNMFNEEPYTEQYGQCGEPGRLIHLSKDLILANNNDSTARSRVAKKILHEWAHYRYGVFDEHGYRNDKFHPDFLGEADSITQKVTSCAADEKGNLLELKVTPQFNKESDCFSHPISDAFPTRTQCHLSVNREKIQSSLMFNQHLSSVSQFCSDQTHNAFSPTKQNRLCDGRSVHEVLRTHPDFRRNYAIRQKCDTKMTIVVEKPPRVAVFSDIIYRGSQALLFQPISYFLTRYDPLVYQLEPNDAVLLKKLTVVTKHHRPDEPVCFYCAIDKLRNRVRNVESDLKDVTNLYIVTAGLFLNEGDLESYAKELRSYDIKVKLILFPYQTDRDYAPLMRFAQAIGAELSVIPVIETDEYPLDVRTRMRLFDALGFQSSSLNPNGVIVLAKSSIRDSDRYHFRFKVDQSLLNANFTIQVMILNSLNNQYLREAQANTTLKINGETRNYELELINFMVDSLVLSVRPDKRSDGLWEVEFKNLVKGQMYEMAAFATREEQDRMPRLDKNFFSGRCWLNRREPIVTLQSKSDRLYAYVSLSRHLHEYIHNVSVRLRIYDDANSWSNSLDMVDDGLGDPDVTQGDGIWSVIVRDVPTQTFLRMEAYVSSEHFGLYSGLMDKPCCGHSVPEQQVTQGYDWLTRVIDCGTVKIDLPDGIDRLARPARAFDLRASMLESSDKPTIKVEVTIPDNIVTLDDIRLFNHSERHLIRSRFDTYGQRLAFIPDSGNKFSGELEIPGRLEESGYYYVAAKLKDSAMNSYLSNVASVYIKGEPEAIPTTNEVLDSYGNIPQNGHRRASYAILGVWQMTAIFVGCFLVILIILLFIICMVAGRRRHGCKDDESDSKKKLPSSLAGNENPDRSVYRSFEDNMMGLKAGSGDSDDGRSVASHPNQPTHNIPHLLSQNNIIGDCMHPNKSISPIDSIPVDKLLEHYDKVKCAKQRNEPLPVMRIEDFTDNGSVNNGSSTTSDNSRFRGSMSGMDENVFMNPIADVNQWHYQPDHYNSPYSQYSYPNPAANYVQHTPSNVMDWQNTYDGSETTSDYDPRYGTVEKRVTAVSQV